MGTEIYVQVGVQALRAPDGTPQKAVPIYEKQNETVAKDTEMELCTDFGAALLPLYKNYAAGVKSLEKETR